MPSAEEVEAEDSAITHAQVTEVLGKLLGGRAPGRGDEIRPKYHLSGSCGAVLADTPLEHRSGVDRTVCSN